EDVDARIRQVNAVLDEIGARDLPTIMVLNKMDTLPGGVPAVHGPAVAVSALTGEGLPALITAIAERLGVTAPVELLLRPDEGRTRAWLYSMGAVLDEQTREDGS